MKAPQIFYERHGSGIQMILKSYEGAIYRGCIEVPWMAMEVPRKCPGGCMKYEWTRHGDAMEMS